MLLDPRRSLVFWLSTRLSEVLLLIVAAASLWIEGPTHGLEALSLATKHLFKLAQVFVGALVLVHGGWCVLCRARWTETRL